MNGVILFQIQKRLQKTYLAYIYMKKSIVLYQIIMIKSLQCHRKKIHVSSDLINYRNLYYIRKTPKPYSEKDYLVTTNRN